MKFTFTKIARNKSSKDDARYIREAIPAERWLVMLLLILLVITLAACNRPQKSLSGVRAGDNDSGNSGPVTNAGDAGGAVLTTERYYEYYDPNGSDLQTELATVKLQFAMSAEGHLLVDGTGKAQWSENAQFPVCGFTAKADGNVSVRGLFNKDDCMFHLTVDTKLSQPTTANQSADCAYPIHFDQTEFSRQIILDPDSPLIVETKKPGVGGWWQTESFKLSELKSEVVQNCFKPEVIERTP